MLQQISCTFPKFSRREKHLHHRAYIGVPDPPPITRYGGTGPLAGCEGAESISGEVARAQKAGRCHVPCVNPVEALQLTAPCSRATVPAGGSSSPRPRRRLDALVGAASRLASRQRRGLQLARRTHVAALVEPAPPFPWGLRFAEPAPTLSPRAAVRRTHIVAKPATGEGIDKSTLTHTQIQIIIIHFLPSPIPPIPNG
jgi:hypothetical protein